MSNNSAPGPDGISFLAWRRLGKLAVDTLFEAHVAITGPNGAELLAAGYPDFNDSKLLLLPKKVSTSEETGESYCTPSDTRPLNVTNSDNRLLASATRLRIEPILEKWISPEQRGFLLGRSMIANVLDIDEMMMTTAIDADAGVAVFFDFRAAFPSVSHTFLLETLGHLGLPVHIVRFVRSLYTNNRCDMWLAGSRHQGFKIDAGIRQGCPLSPLLFAVAADLLLRRLRRLFPTASLRAYADDLAMVIPEGVQAFGRLEATFTEYALLSGLELNIKKTCVVPLYEVGATSLSLQISGLAPSWSGLQITYAAKYLGFYLGPGRGQLTWQGPLKKFRERVEMWAKHGLGPHYTLAAYSVYIMPVLLFVAQLDAPPDEWSALEKWAIRRLFPGPGNWITAAATHNLRALGLPREMGRLDSLALAAKFRVATWEASGSGGIKAVSRAARLGRRLNGCHHLSRVNNWYNWFSHSFLAQLAEAERSCAGKGVTCDAMMHQLSNNAPRPWTLAVHRTVKKSWQKEAYMRIRPSPVAELSVYLRDRLARWRLSVLQGHRPQRTLSALPVLRNRVAPKIITAVIRTILNGWVTNRRFPGAVASCRCMLGCEAPDDIEHYASCRMVSSFAWRRLRLKRAQFPEDRLADFLLLNVPTRRIQDHVDQLRCQAIRTAAVYQLHNLWRHTCMNADAAAEALDQIGKELLIA